MPLKQDIAKRAGVSTATVSNALNGKKNVSSKLMQRIIDAANELNYPLPNINVDPIKEIVFVVKDPTNPHQGMILEGMTEVAQKNDMMVSMMMIWDDVDAFCKMLIHRGVYAVKFATIDFEVKPSHIALLNDANIDVSFCWNNFIVDFETVMDKTIKYLNDLGHKRILYLNGFSLENPNNPRLIAFKNAIKKYNLENDPDLIVDGIYPYITDTQSGYWATRSALDSNISFTAVIATNDLLALGAMRALSEKGIQIPKDVSVIGCDDIPYSSYSSPPLTTLRLPARKIGHYVMYDILQKSLGNQYKPHDMEIELIIRKSTSKIHD